MGPHLKDDEDKYYDKDGNPLKKIIGIIIPTRRAFTYKALNKLITRICC